MGQWEWTVGVSGGKAQKIHISSDALAQEKIKMQDGPPYEWHI